MLARSFVRSLLFSFPTRNPLGIYNTAKVKEDSARFGRIASTIAQQSLKAFNLSADIKSHMHKKITHPYSTGIRKPCFAVPLARLPPAPAICQGAT